MTAKKPTTDWEKVEGLYRAGQLSLAEIGARCGISKQAIDRKAKRLGWTRDLGDKVRQEVATKLARRAVDDAVDGHHAKAKRQHSEREIIEASAMVGAEVVECHRRDIKAGRELCTLLIGELYQATTHLEQIEQAIDEETRGDANGQRRALMRRAVSLPSRAGVIRDLTGAMKNLQALERVAFGLDEKDDGIPEYEAELKRLNALEPPGE